MLAALELDDSEGRRDRHPVRRSEGWSRHAEMVTPTSVIIGARLGKDVALVIDGPFSGGSHGFIVGHVTPEAQEGGPIALARDCDRITIGASRNTLWVALSNDELEARRQNWQMPPYKAERGTLAKSSAS